MTEETITIKKESIWKYSTFILVALLIIVLFVFLGKGNTPTTGNVVAPDDSVVPGVKAATIDDDAILGEKDAPVTIIEFSDYQCPFCRKFWTETFPQIKKDYIDSGKVNMVFRDFPLDFHQAALPAAQAAECVREKGGDSAYWKMHDKMFAEQNKLDSGRENGAVTKTITFGESDIISWAKELGYDIGDCLKSGKYISEVQKDQADGAAAGVQGTPAFFVNGKLLSGAQPYSAFKQAIDAELS